MPRPATERTDGLHIDIKGFEGPLDVLLALARVQKIDLREISIVQLVDQYLDFIRQLKKLQLDIAADYLVMAAWLAYLKSRLLLPEEEEEELSAEELAERLRHQLARLEAMREAAQKIYNRPQLGRDVFARQMPEGIRINRTTDYYASLYELLAAYTSQRLRNQATSWTPEKLPVLSLEDARKQLENSIGLAVDWTVLDALLSQELAQEMMGGLEKQENYATFLASTFVAALEFAKEEKVYLRQTQNFGPIMLKLRPQEN